MPETDELICQSVQNHESFNLQSQAELEQLQDSNYPEVAESLRFTPSLSRNQPPSSEFLTSSYDRLSERVMLQPHANGQSLLMVDFETDSALASPSQFRLQPSAIVERVSHAYDVLFGAISINSSATVGGQEMQASPRGNIGSGVDGCNENPESRWASHHPRIVRRQEKLLPYGLVFERLHPGPLQKLELPSFTTFDLPYPAMSPDASLLSLYLQWALQTLSAMSFMHGRGVFFRSFSSSNVWIRDDLSVAVANFVSKDHSVAESTSTSRSVTSSAATEPSSYDHDHGDGENGDHPATTFAKPNGNRVSGMHQTEHHSVFGTPVEKGQVQVMIKEDLWGWMVFARKLLLGGFSSNPHEHFKPLHLSQDMDKNMREDPGVDQQRLGPVLAKIARFEYETADEALQDVIELIQKHGRKIVGGRDGLQDSVYPGAIRRWARDVFAVVHSDSWSSDWTSKLKFIVEAGEE